MSSTETMTCLCDTDIVERLDVQWYIMVAAVVILSYCLKAVMTRLSVCTERLTALELSAAASRSKHATFVTHADLDAGRGSAEKLMTKANFEAWMSGRRQMFGGCTEDSFYSGLSHDIHQAAYDLHTLETRYSQREELIDCFPHPCEVHHNIKFVQEVDRRVKKLEAWEKENRTSTVTATPKQLRFETPSVLAPAAAQSQRRPLTDARRAPPTDHIVIGANGHFATQVGKAGMWVVVDPVICAPDDAEGASWYVFDGVSERPTDYVAERRFFAVVYAHHLDVADFLEQAAGTIPSTSSRSATVHSYQAATDLAISWLTRESRERIRRVSPTSFLCPSQTTPAVQPVRGELSLR